MPRKRLCFDKSPAVNKTSKNVELADSLKMESPPKAKLKPQKLPWLVLSGPEKDSQKDKSVEKQKLKPQRLPELQDFDLIKNGWSNKVPTSAPSSSQGKNFKDTVHLKPQKLLLCASAEGKSKEKSLEKPKLKPRRLPEFQDFLPNQNEHMKPQPAFIQTKPSSRESFAAKRTHNDLQSGKPQRKKPKLDQPVVRRNLFKEPAQQKKSKVFGKKKSKGSLPKKEAALKVTEASIIDDIRPLEITLPTIEKKLDDIEANMPKSCSPTPSEEFLALENALERESSSSDVDTQTMPKNNTINGQDREQIVEIFYAELDAIQSSMKQQLEKIMAETDKKIAKLKEDFKNSFQKCNGNKENIVVRRSPRLIKIRSPAFSPINTNLRMSTLKKNFQKKVLFQDSTPKSEKVKKAEVMYNSLRQNHPLLRTPKFKSEKEEMSQEQSLSVVLQQQCLMLQDTPAHK